MKKKQPAILENCKKKYLNLNLIRLSDPFDLVRDSVIISGSYSGHNKNRNVPCQKTYHFKNFAQELDQKFFSKLVIMTPTVILTSLNGIKVILNELLTFGNFQCITFNY